jgi:hypothetical protein
MMQQSTLLQEIETKAKPFKVPISSRNDAAYQRESTPLQEIDTKAKLVKVPVILRNDAAYQRESTPIQEVETEAKVVAGKLIKRCCLSRRIHSTTGGRGQGEVSCW